MSEYPNTIDNGGGEQLTFVGIGHDERGEYLEIRNTVAPGAGPPMHAHYLQEEGLTVERGTMGYQTLGGKERRAGPGESATFAPEWLTGSGTPGMTISSVRVSSARLTISSTSSQRSTLQCGATEESGRELSTVRICREGTATSLACWRSPSRYSASSFR